jgi:KDO2-lipid IV(A) lauroyltransferase
MLIVLRFLGKIIAWVSYYLGLRRTVTLDNIKNAYPDIPLKQQEHIAKGSYTNIGIVFAEMLYLRFASKKNIKAHIMISNPDVYHNALAKGKGLIVIAAHFANWEWLALGGAMRLDTNFSIVRKNIQRSFTEQFLSRMRIRTGNTLINAGDIRGIYHTLQAGNCIALLADQAAPGESTRVKFFNREVPTFEGPARLALRTNAPILFAECLRDNGGNYLVTFDPINYSDLKRDSPDNIHELTLRHTQTLEQVIRKHPEQWLWLHKRWKYV